MINTERYESVATITIASNRKLDIKICDYKVTDGLLSRSSWQQGLELG
jgi:hypothetical protein